MSGENKKHKLSIVIPTKNEAKTIKEVITKVKPYADEVLVVDGHSEDNTRRIAEQNGAKVILDNGKGKGAALRLAIKKCSHNIIVLIDADGSHDPEDIPKLIKPLKNNEADIVIGSRITGGSDELYHNQLIRLVLSKIITLVVNLRFRIKLTDTQNGFRAIKKEIAQELGLKEDIFTIEQEMVMKALKKGYEIKEIPSHERKRKHGKSHISILKMGHRYAWCLFKNLF